MISLRQMDTVVETLTNLVLAVAQAVLTVIKRVLERE